LDIDSITLRGLIYYFLTLPFIQKVAAAFFSTEIPSPLGVAHVPIKTSDSIKSAILFGIYEHPERYLISKFLPRDKDVLELGSSLGIVTRSILKLLAPGRRVVSLDANIDLKDFWDLNVSKYLKSSRQAILENCLIAYSNAAGFIYGPDSLSGRASQSGPVKRVRNTSLQQVLKQFSFHDEFSLIIDIEGMEYMVLAQESDLVRRAAFVCVEMHGSEEETLAFLKSMRQLGFFLLEQKHAVYAWAKSP